MGRFVILLGLLALTTLACTQPEPTSRATFTPEPALTATPTIAATAHTPAPLPSPTNLPFPTPAPAATPMSPPTDALLDEVTSIATTHFPDSIEIISFTVNEREMLLGGKATDHTTILSFAGKIRDSEFFADATIVEMSGSGAGPQQNGMKFNILAIGAVSTTTTTSPPTAARTPSGTLTPLSPLTSPGGTFEILVPSATFTSTPNPNERFAAPFPCLAKSQFAYAEGKALDSQSEHAKAIEKMDEVIRLDPQCAVAYSSRGFAALHIGRNEEALRDYNEAIRLAPEAGDLYNSLYNRGGVYSDLGQYRLAIQDYNEAIRLYPGQAWLYDARARTYERMGDQQKAKADIDQACQLDVDGTWCRAAELPRPAGQPELNPLASNPLRTNLPTRGFFTNSSSGNFSEIDKLVDPTSLAVLGILLTLLATSISLFKGN